MRSPNFLQHRVLDRPDCDPVISNNDVCASGLQIEFGFESNQILARVTRLHLFHTSFRTGEGEEQENENKKIRPIAVGDVFRQLAGKTLLLKHERAVRDRLQPSR